MNCLGCGKVLPSSVRPRSRKNPSASMCRACKRFDKRASKVVVSPTRYLCNCCYRDVAMGERICSLCRSGMKSDMKK